jgi:hypothetical protein
MTRIAVGLLHYPIYDSQKKIIATNVTNLDIHDIARACRVYGVERYYVIHPMQDQLAFVARVLEHWRVGDGVKFNPMRRTSLTMVHTAPSLDAAVADWGCTPRLAATHAKSVEGKETVTFKNLREELKKPDGQPLFLLFGTGFGLTEEVMDRCDLLIEPIRGASEDDYRHLSVRSAASICLDRLLGPW